MDENNSLEVDTTSFMNLMVVLIPILLFSMGFKTYFSVDLSFPAKIMVNKDVIDLKKEQKISVNILKNKEIEVSLVPGGLYSLVRNNDDTSHDIQTYQNILRELKLSFLDKKNISIYMYEKLPYDVMVKFINASSAYSEGESIYELFPDTSLGIIHE